MNPYLAAVLSNFCWGLGSQFYTYYGRKFSSLWVNSFKALIASFFFLITVLLFGGLHEISSLPLLAFFLSGILGLGVADIFLVKSFTTLGPGRTLMLYAFQPIFIGVMGYFLFSQTIDYHKFISIIFFIICILIFSIESYQKSGSFNIKSTLFALCGIIFDGTGVLLTRYAFNNAPQINIFEGNFYRAIAAIIFFLIISKFVKFSLRSNFNNLKMSRKFLCLGGAFIGTFLSLAFYLQAVKTGVLAVVTSIAVTSVIFASIFECIFEKKLPTKYLYYAFIFFLTGMYFLLFY